MNEVIAIIPARSGSKSIIDKNITLLFGHPLIAYSIAVAKLSKKIDRVIVSTDSQYYAEISSLYGAEVPFLRPVEYAKDTSTDRDFLLHAMNWLGKNEQKIPEYWIHLRPTTPLRSSLIIDEAIDLIMNNSSAISLRSGHKAPESPLKWFKIDECGYFHGLVGNDKEKEIYNLPKESFDNVYIPDGYVDIVKSSHVMHNKTIHGNNMIGFESPVCTEVDSPQEFEYIQYQLKKTGSLLLDYLNQCIAGKV
jgi:CMP-N,N'-diacetyllegionaminic acid synthase